MIGFVIAVAVITGAIVATALILPCPACERRRERLQQAYQAWRAGKDRPPAE